MTKLHLRRKLNYCNSSLPNIVDYHAQKVYNFNITFCIQILLHDEDIKLGSITKKQFQFQLHLQLLHKIKMQIMHCNR